MSQNQQSLFPLRESDVKFARFRQGLPSQALTSQTTADAFWGVDPAWDERWTIVADSEGDDDSRWYCEPVPEGPEGGDS